MKRTSNSHAGAPSYLPCISRNTDKLFAKNLSKVALGVLLMSSSQLVMAEDIEITYSPLVVNFGDVEVPVKGTLCKRGIGSKSIDVGLTVKRGSPPKAGYFWKEEFSDSAFEVYMGPRRMPAAKTMVSNSLQLHFKPTTVASYSSSFATTLLNKSQIRDIINADIKQRIREEEQKAKKKGSYLLDSEIKKIKDDVKDKYSDYPGVFGGVSALGQINQQPTVTLRGRGICNKPVIKPAKVGVIKGTGGLTETPKGPKGQPVKPPKTQTTNQPQPGQPKKPVDEDKQNPSTTPKLELDPGKKSIPGAKSSFNLGGNESTRHLLNFSLGSTETMVALVEDLENENNDQQITSALDPRFVIATDVNADGYGDQIGLDRTAQTVLVSIGNGDGSLQQANRYSLSGKPNDIAVLDVTGDGIVDVVTVNQSSNDVSVLVGEGGGSFQGTPLSIHSEQDPQQLAATGLHAPLLYDLALAARFSDQVTLIHATNSVDHANQNATIAGQLPKSIRRQSLTWEMDVNGNLYFIGVDGLGYHYQGTTLTILDQANPGSESRVIENVRKVILTDSQGHEIDPYDL